MWYKAVWNVNTIPFNLLLRAASPRSEQTEFGHDIFPTVAGIFLLSVTEIHRQDLSHRKKRLKPLHCCFTNTWFQIQANSYKPIRSFTKLIFGGLANLLNLTKKSHKKPEKECKYTNCKNKVFKNKTLNLD